MSLVSGAQRYDAPAQKYLMKQSHHEWNEIVEQKRLQQHASLAVKTDRQTGRKRTSKIDSSCNKCNITHFAVKFRGGWWKENRNKHVSYLIFFFFLNITKIYFPSCCFDSKEPCNFCGPCGFIEHVRNLWLSPYIQLSKSHFSRDLLSFF